MSLQVVVDSTACFTPEIFKKYNNLHSVSLNISLGDKQWREDSLSAKELFALVESTGHFPRTSQPAPGDFIKVIEPLVNAGHEVIVITLSSALSGTLQSAKTAASLVGGKNIYVLDSESALHGMQNMARVALEMAEQGFNAKDIVLELEKMVKATQTIFMPETLDYLYKGGRIGGAAALFGTILNIKPILYLVDGQVKVLEKIRTKGKAIKRMLQEIEGKQLVWVGVPHLEAPQEAQELAEKIQSMHPGVEVTIQAGGAVLGAHLGAGVIGIIYQHK